MVNLGGHRQPSGTSARLAQVVVALEYCSTQGAPAVAVPVALATPCAWPPISLVPGAVPVVSRSDPVPLRSHIEMHARQWVPVWIHANTAKTNVLCQPDQVSIPAGAGAQDNFLSTRQVEGAIPAARRPALRAASEQPRAQ